MFHHVPVMLDEVLEGLRPNDGAHIVDCTVGGGGHAEALLRAANCRVLGLDRDPAAIAAATARCEFAGDRFVAQRSDFESIGAALDLHGWATVDGILADLGVSSHQLDTASRGFSFQREGPIDMRMDPDSELTAAEIVNEWPSEELADILYRFGEERRARRVAAAIVAGRPWSDTLSLASAVASVVGGKGRIHPATRTFQALRIATNRELAQVEALLSEGVKRLSPGGRFGVISFHSLEDRIVKKAFATGAGKNRPRDPYGNPVGEVFLKLVSSSASREGDPNPRARSARLRVVERLP